MHSLTATCIKYPAIGLKNYSTYGNSVIYLVCSVDFIVRWVVKPFVLSKIQLKGLRLYGTVVAIVL